jgi:ankyrin repeat protein
MKISTFNSPKQLLELIYSDPDFKQLLDKAAQENGPGPIGWDALHKGDFQAYEKLKAEGAKFDWVDVVGRHPMHVAARGGNVKILADLLDTFGHNIDVLQESDGETPIIRAVSASKVEAVQFLRDRGANLDVEPTRTKNFHQRVKAYDLKV